MTAWDESGYPTVWTTVTEPRFDDDERELWVALHEHEQSLCPRCGRPTTVCSDPLQPWWPQRTTCWATAAKEVAQRQFHANHEEHGPNDRGYLPQDGVSIWVASADLTPSDDPLVTHERPGESQ